MKRLVRDVQKKYSESQIKKFTVLGYLILIIPSIPLIYWMVYLFIHPYVEIVKFITNLFK